MLCSFRSGNGRKGWGTEASTVGIHRGESLPNHSNPPDFLLPRKSLEEHLAGIRWGFKKTLVYFVDEFVLRFESEDW